VELLESKKSFFNDRLQEEKAKYSFPIKKKLNKLFRQYSDDLFRIDSDLIKQGGEDALVLQYVAGITRQIELCNDHLNKMPKDVKGYFYNSYSSAQLEERRSYEKKLSELDSIRGNREICLQRAIRMLGVSVNPIAHLRSGTLENLLAKNVKSSVETKS